MAKGITAQEMDATTASGLVPHLGTTTNSGNSYSVASNTPISTNQKFTIKFNVASSTAPTLKINNNTALPIKKANGNNAKLYASIYTLFWDGSAFILQGEGGGGTLQPNQALAGFTFTNDNGEQIGLGDPNLKPENIRSGVKVFEVPGTLRPSTSGFIELNLDTWYQAPRDKETSVTVATIPAGTKLMYCHIPDKGKFLLRMTPNDNHTGYTTTAVLCLVDSNGNKAVIYQPDPPDQTNPNKPVTSFHYLDEFSFSHANGKSRVDVAYAPYSENRYYEFSIPANFNTDSVMKLDIIYNNIDLHATTSMQVVFKGTLMYS